MKFLALLLIPLAAAPVAALAQAADSAGVYELSAVEVLPRPQNAQEFAAALARTYPPSLRDAGVSGTVHLAFVVGADGQVGAVQVVSATDSAFAAPSVQAASLLRFSPAQVQGRAVAVRVEQPVHWRVEPPPVAATDTVRPRSASPEVDAYELSDVDELPRVRNLQAFSRVLERSYPPVLRDAGLTGTVQVRFRVEVDGTISNARVTAATDARFIEPTLAAVQVLRFRPARVNGRPVPAWVEQPIQWSVARGLGSGTEGRPGGPGSGTEVRPLGEPGAGHRPRFSPPDPCPPGRAC